VYPSSISQHLAEILVSTDIEVPNPLGLGPSRLPIASYPGLRGEGKRRPGAHCLHMRVIREAIITQSTLMTFWKGVGFLDDAGYIKRALALRCVRFIF